MKLILLILITTLMQVSAATFAQKVTLKENGLTMERMFKEIRKQTGYNVIMDNSKLIKSRINANFENTQLEDVMTFLVKGTDFTFTIEDKVIVIREKTLLDRALLVIQSISKDLTVKGKVTDQDGKPLPNASIRVKGKSAVTNTNQNGEFEIKGVDEDAVLLVSYVGFKTLEIGLKDAVMPLEIKLNVATGELEEVKVTYSTGYQNIPKERATGSFVQLSNEDINRTVSTNILDRIKAVTGSLKDGPIDGNRDISIRGLSTIFANQVPLIVVDGFPYEEDAILSINNINPNDVESITILRDAAAASIWGALSANGVIVITTKKGKYNEKTKVQFNTSINISERPDLFKVSVMSSKDAIEYEKRLFASGYYDSYNGPFTSTYSYPSVSPAIEIMLAQKRGSISKVEEEEQLNKLSNHDVRNDVDKYMIRQSLSQQYNVNISGGSDKMNYFGSIGYDNNTATTIGNNDNRLTFRIFNSYRPIKKIEISTFIQYTQNKSKNNGLNYISFLGNGNNVAPYTMLADGSGNPLHIPQGAALRTAYIDTIATKGLLDWHYRPLEEIKNNDNTSRIFNSRLGGEIKYTLIPGLRLGVNGQYERSLTNTNNYYSTKSYFTRNLVNSFMFLNTAGIPQYPVPNAGILSNSLLERTVWNFRSTIDLNQSWGNHSLAGIFGMDIRESESDSNNSRKYGYDPNTLNYSSNMDYNTVYNQRPTSGGRISDGNLLQGRLDRFLSYYSNMAYSFSNKYTISGSARIDASNFFGIKANLRYVPLWSVGAVWDITRENFFNSNSINYLKVRATYGFNGNLDNSATSLPTIGYNIGTSQYNNSQQYANIRTPSNPGLTWERVKVINVALDFSFKNDRLSGSLEYYQKKGKNLIANIEADRTVGFTNYRGNYAGLNGEGVDLNLNGTILNRGVTIKTSINFSYNIDKIVYFLNPIASLDNGGSYITGGVLPINKPLNKIYSYKWGGLDPTNGNPLGVVNDMIVPFTYALGNTGSESNTKLKDIVYHGPSSAPYFGNMINTISYKGLSLSFNVTYKFGFYFRRQSVNYTNIQNFWGGHGDYSLRWKKTGDELYTNVPSLPSNVDNRYTFYQNSEILVEKGDFVRLQDIKFSYDLNKVKFKKLPFNSATIFAYANNMGLLWTANDKGIDPEFDNRIPTPLSLAFGLNINF